MAVTHQSPDSYILEISKRHDVLQMALYRQDEYLSTLRHYTQIRFSEAEIESFTREMMALLLRAERSSAVDNRATLDDLRKIGQLLWDQLLTRPVKDRIKALADAHLIISIDEELVAIPWELFFTGDEFLCLWCNMGRVVKTKQELVPARYRSLSGPPKMLILANPTNDLPSSYAEGLAIKNNLDRRRQEITIDFKSTEIDLRYVKKNVRDYDIVHFAGHCGFDRRDPGQSGWVLRDGLFSITDIFSLGETSALPSLIFSNACTSALFADSLDQGRCQEQAFGIASAFLFSGVRHYIGSVQKIEDKASLDFAQAFYQGLLAGESVGQSLRKGRLALIKEHGFAYTWWASYLLYGDPGYVVFPQKAKMPEACSVSQFKRVGIALASAALVSLLLGLSAHVVLSKTKPAAYIRLAQARHLYSQGKNAESIALAQAIINNDPGFRPAYRILAEAYERIGDRQNAIRHYFDYAVLSERAHDTANLLDAYLGIGWLYHAMGNFEKAFEFYDKTLTVSKAKSAILHQAVALRKMAVWYIDQENYDKAMELLLKSSQINRERQHSLEHRYHLACDYFDIGLVFSNKDDFAAAKEFYAKSQKLFSSLRQKNELSDYYFNMGELYLFEKEYQNALGCYQKGLAIDKLHGNKPNLASGYDMLGELFVEMDDFTQAEHSFKQAIAISEAIDAPQELASAHYNLGLLYKRLNKKNRAREQLRLAQEIYSISNPASYQEVKEELLSLDK